MIAPPVAGMCSIPVQVRLVEPVSDRLDRGATTNRRQKPRPPPLPPCLLSRRQARPPARPAAKSCPAPGAWRATPGPAPVPGTMSGCVANWAVVLPVKPPAAGKSRLRGALPGVPHDAAGAGPRPGHGAAALACAERGRGDRGHRRPPARPRRWPTLERPAACRSTPGGGLNPRAARAAPGRRRPAGRRPAGRPAGAATRADAGAPPCGLAATDAARYVRRRARHRHRAAGRAAGRTAGSRVSGWARRRRTPRVGRRAPGRELADPAPRRGHGRPICAAAAALGLGPAHRRACVGYACWHAGHRGDLRPGTRSGTVLLDDGSELAYPAAAFDASGLRLLRLGQRVRIDRDAAGTVDRASHIPTLP